MIKSVAPKFNITISIGLKEGYNGKINSLEYIQQLCQEFVNENKTCVTITPTQFVYVNGNEPGAFIGLINYARFPTTKSELTLLSFELAEHLMKKLNQYRCSVITEDMSYLLENDDMI